MLLEFVIYVGRRVRKEKGRSYNFSRWKKGPCVQQTAERRKRASGRRRENAARSFGLNKHEKKGEGEKDKQRESERGRGEKKEERGVGGDHESATMLDGTNVARIFHILS